MSRGQVWLVICLILLLSGLQLKQVDARIVVGVSTVNVAFLPIYVTQDKGFFKGEGLDVLVVMFNAGNTNLRLSSAAMCKLWPAECRKPCWLGQAASRSRTSG